MGSERVERLLQELETLVGKMEDSLREGKKIAGEEIERASNILREITQELFVSEEGVEMPSVFETLTDIVLRDENLEFPLEAKVSLYPYLVMFSEKVEEELDRFIDNPSLLMEKDGGRLFLKLAEKFLELFMLEAFKDLVLNGKNVDEEIALQAYVDAAFHLVNYLKENLDMEVFPWLELVLREIAVSPVESFHPGFVEKLGVVTSELPSVLEKLLNEKGEGYADVATRLALLLKDTAVKYRKLLKDSFDRMDSELPEEARPQFVIVSAKLCSLLYKEGYELSRLVEDFAPIFEDYGYSVLEFERLCREGPKAGGVKLFPQERGIILDSPSKERVAEIARDSVFPVTVSGRVGDRVFQVRGSAFVYKQTRTSVGYKLYLLTNLHNVQGIHRVLNDISKHYRGEEEVDLKFGVKIDDEFHEITSVYVPIKEVYDQVLMGNPEFSRFDFAVFTVESQSPRKFFGIRKNSEVKQGETVYAFGYPHGLKLSMSEGIVSHVYDKVDDLEVHHIPLLGTIQHTILINPGNSGGPTVKEDGELVGISTFGLKQGVGLNFSIDIRFVVECLQDRNFIAVFKVHDYVSGVLKRLRLERSLF